MTSPTDGQLLAAWRAGDGQALFDLLRRYETEMWRLARHILKDRWEAEDAVQESLLRAFEKLDQLRDGDKFRAWVRGIVRHTCADFQRRTRPIPLSDPPEQATGPETDIERRIDIEDALLRMPEEQAVLLYQVDVLDRKIEDLAPEYGTSSGALRKRLALARTRLSIEVGHITKRRRRGPGQGTERPEGGDDT